MKKKQPVNKSRYTVYLEPHQIDALRKLRENTGISTAYFIRRAIDEALRR